MRCFQSHYLLCRNVASLPQFHVAATVGTLDAYAFTGLWLEKLASVIETMPHTYFKQYFLTLLPDNIIHDNDPVMLLALRLYR